MMFRGLAALVVCASLVVGCADERADGSASRRPTRSTNAPASAHVDPAQAARLRNIMAPLVAHMDHPLAPGEVKITLMSDPHLNAANGGGGDFYVTTGLLQRSSDDHLRAILAHEIAHADLGHVAKAQTLAAGLGIGTLILDQILPGVGAVAPLAGELVQKAHSRSEESEADAHAVTILKRAGFDGKTLLADALTWIQRTEGGSGGGFFASHPATAERVQTVRNLP